MILVGNKSDLSREVNIEDAIDIADKYCLKYFETSSLNGQNVKEVRDRLSRCSNMPATLM